MRFGSWGVNLARGGIGTCCQDCCAKAREPMERTVQSSKKHPAASSAGFLLGIAILSLAFGRRISGNVEDLMALSRHLGQYFLISGRSAAPAAFTSDASREILRQKAGLRMIDFKSFL